ncbi:hypothetical protein Rxycam_00790 [Rubrobacter xylanophilus DSM 9941]|uniref:LPXTG cell wall anchor domain-containing protein n=1 Tax=Rubrobacter xylanophilus TaxID=49319 RepID=UPI001C63FE67|nr:LPXTG cell wall anchor domain-containing protein [Rubrobacter xylanophilus]QYJ14979.1 hypothetical protein Rxycam_00790 [Rubrobacter xylanophilus DSM 9941]
MNHASTFMGGGFRQLTVFSLVALLVAVLSLGVVARVARAQSAYVTLPIIAETTVGEQCNPDGTRDVTTTADFGSALNDPGIPFFEEVVLPVLRQSADFSTQYREGEQLVATARPGETVALEPGTYTVTTRVQNLNELEDLLNAFVPPGSERVELGVIGATEQVVVSPCPGDDGQQPGGGGDVIGDFSGLTLGDCSNIIQNSGDASIVTVQYCEEIINNITNNITNNVTNHYGARRVDAPVEPGVEGGGEDVPPVRGGDGIAVSGSGDELGYGAAGSGGSGASNSEPEDRHGGGEVGAYGGLTELPDTGGPGLLVVGAMLTLVAGGLLARRIVR